MKKLGLVLGGLLFGLLSVEVFLHVGGFWPEVSWEWQLESPWRVPDRSAILISPEFLEEKHYDTGGAERIVVALGDSFTEGYPVGVDSAWPALLEAGLEKAGEHTRVINMGLGNSGPHQQVRILEDHVMPRLVPDDVVWAFYANDLMNDRVQNTFSIRDDQLVPLDASEHWIYRRLQVWRGIPLPGTIRSRSAILRNYIHSWENRERPEAVADPSADEHQLGLLLERVFRQAYEKGFRLWLVLIKPEIAYMESPETIERANHLLEDHYRLRDILSGRQLLFEMDFAADDLRISDIFVDSSRDGAAPGDHHFNEEGQRRMATRLVDLLR